MGSWLPRVDVDTIRFSEPQYLWLLAIPAVLLLVWIWQVERRRRDVQRFRYHRQLPVRERFPPFGGLLFWLCLLIASAWTIVALARPIATVALVRTGGTDLVILQDGSASMRVRDVTGNRWQRSITFLRALGEGLRWKEDRIAMALFAHIAVPQIRLTTDPNTFFFFLDHLNRESPFRLEDDTTWDTNIELGIYWGLRLIEKDEELHGHSSNAKAFVLVSDGQAWSGQVEQTLKLARSRDIPVFVIGVGTSGGGIIPEPIPPDGQSTPLEASSPILSMLDRDSLGMIATAGGGRYFELDREPDHVIANSIIDAARKRAGPRGVEATAEELYWRCLLIAAAVLCVGAMLLREGAELWLQVAGAAATMLAIATLTR